MASKLRTLPRFPSSNFLRKPTNYAHFSNYGTRHLICEQKFRARLLTHQFKNAFPPRPSGRDCFLAILRSSATLAAQWRHGVPLPKLFMSFPNSTSAKLQAILYRTGLRVTSSCFYQGKFSRHKARLDSSHASRKQSVCPVALPKSPRIGFLPAQLLVSPSQVGHTSSAVLLACNAV
jgi:hypothetical protein